MAGALGQLGLVLYAHRNIILCDFETERSCHQSISDSAILSIEISTDNVFSPSVISILRSEGYTASQG